MITILNKKTLLLLGYIATFLLAVFMTGCVTTSIKASDCHRLDWQALGKKDGSMGYDSQQIAKYQKVCGLPPNARQSWELGRQEGLKSYCTKSNAYYLGQRGLPLNAVCPEAGLLEIQQSHALGINQYYQRERLNRLYGTPFYNAPWFDGYYPYFYLPF